MKPIEPEKQEIVASTTTVVPQVTDRSVLAATTTDESILPKVNIDVFRERTLQKGNEVK